MSELNILRLPEIRQSLWHAELAGWLHNIGKITEAFTFYSTKGTGYQEFKEKFRHEYITGALLSADVKSFPNGPDKDKGELLRFSAANFEKESPKAFVTIFNLPIKLPGPPPIVIGQLIELQASIWRDIQPAGRLAEFYDPVLQLLVFLSHRQASGQDKTDTESEQKQTGKNEDLEKLLRENGQKLPWKSATAFGHESELDLAKYPEILKSVAHAITTHTGIFRSNLRRNLYQLMNGAIADSRRPIHDTRVGDMGKMAAAFFKSQLALELLQPGTTIRQWRLLRVAVNGPAFVAAAIRSADAVARRAYVKHYLNKVQDALENYTPLANEVYRDEFGSVFVCASLNAADAAAAKTIEDPRLFSIVTEALHFRPLPTDEEFQHELQLSPSFAMGESGEYSFCLLHLLERPVPIIASRPAALAAVWAGRDNTEICSVCRLRPVGEQKSHAARQRSCDVCFDRRVGRSRRWLNDQKTTIWIDEVADTNGRIALVGARLRLERWLAPDGYIEKTLLMAVDLKTEYEKGASAARVARLWETARDFWTGWRGSLSERLHRPARIALAGRLPYEESEIKFRSGQSYTLIGESGKLRNLKISVVCRDDKFKSILIADNLRRLASLAGLKDKQELSAADFLKGATFLVEQPTGYGSPDKQLGRFTLIANAIADEIPYNAIIPLLSDPMLMMAVLPASEALAAARQLQKAYNCQMAQVTNRLGLDIGIVWAPSETPFSAILDAGRRIFHRKLTAKSSLFDKVPDGMAVSDQWFPYFQSPGGNRIHVSKLKPGDSVMLEPSTFEFEYLDSASRRFDLSYDTNHRRRDVHRSHRPFCLSQFGLFDETERILKEYLFLGTHKAKTHQLKALDGILHQKYQLWNCESWGGLDKTFIGWTLHNVEWGVRGPTAAEFGTLASAVSAGILADLLEIELGIRKAGRG